MAEKEEKKEGEAPAAEVKPKKSKLPLIIGGIVGLVILAGVPVFFFMKKSETTNGVEEVGSNAAHSNEKSSDGSSLEGSGEEDQHEENEEPIGAIFPLHTFVVNLTGGKYVRTQIQVEFVDRDVPQRFYVRQVQVRDSLLSLLTKRTADDILSETGKEALRKAIKDTINAVIKKDDVKTVYFTQFVVQ